MIVYDFNRRNCLLQPWRYHYELARRFVAAGCCVTILTNGQDSSEDWPESFRVVRTNALAVVKQSELTGLLNFLSPDAIWWSMTPRSVAFLPTVRAVAKPTIAVITCPLYSWGHLFKAFSAHVPYSELKTLLLQRMIPPKFFVQMLSHPSICAVVTQSRANAMALDRAGVAPKRLHVLPVGLDREDREDVSQESVENARARLSLPEESTLYLYLGSLYAIRGLPALLRALPLLVQKKANAHLLVLARDADDDAARRVVDSCGRFGVGDHIHVIGGRLERRTIRAFIRTADVVVLPFILAPSDVPIAVLEAMAMGKPVVSTTVDGIPELLENGRGVVVENALNTESLANALASLPGYSVQSDKISRFMSTYPDWDQVSQQALGYLNGLG